MYVTFLCNFANSWLVGCSVSASFGGGDDGDGGDRNDTISNITSNNIGISNYAEPERQDAAIAAAAATTTPLKK